jgi:uncharacterized membrane protein YcaP (DUF421 family)
MDTVLEWLGVGVEPKEFTILHVSCRAFLFFFVTLIVVRLARRRFLSKMTPMDVILGFILASMLARAVNGSAPVGPTIVGAIVLIALHRTLATLAYLSNSFGRIVKGEPAVLVRDGKIDWKRMKRHRVSEKDLLEEARLNGKTDQIDQIRLATLERNGEISVLDR